MVRTSLSLNVGTLDMSHISLQEGRGDALVSLLAARWSCHLETFTAEASEREFSSFGLGVGYHAKYVRQSAWTTLQCLQKADIPGPQNPRRRDCWPEDGIDFMHGLGMDVG